jgi:light-regulated signal transduction histidine kinase (bacteriophytochrome)
LRAIDGFSNIVLKAHGSQLPDEGRRRLHIIRESAQRMGMLIEDLLRFSKLGRRPLMKAPVDMERLARESYDELRSSQTERRIAIEIARLPAAEGDPALLKQVWVNLLSNAIKYTRGCTLATIEVGCSRERGCLVYFVRDNGAGFDMRYASKLFGVFQRLHRAEEFEGTGAGLAIVQRIVQRHGGRIWADAAVGRGATFFFTLESEGTE